MTVTRRLLAAAGDAGDMRTWAGIPYHFFQAGQATGFFSAALDLQVERLRWSRLRWNMLRMLKGQGKGGYQYSESFLRAVFRTVAEEVEDAEVISHFQLFPSITQAAAAHVTTNYYIDLPLSRLFEEYGIHRTVGRGVAQSAILREQEGYNRARRVVCMSSWCARSVRQEYDIPFHKLYTILPGANLDEAVVEAVTSGVDGQPIEAVFDSRRPFRLGFVGKDYRRKGLPKLVEAARILKARGHSVEVVVIGDAPQELKNDSTIRWLGYIDKRTDMERFVRAIAATDLGCLLSSAEGLGISTLEFLRVGVPVIGSDVGGITDCVPKDAGLLLPKDAASEEVADVLERLIKNPDFYATMRREVRRIRHRFSWSQTIAQFHKVWGE